MLTRDVDDAATADNPDVRHETSDVNIRAILGFGFGLIVTAIVIHFAVWLLFIFFVSRDAPGAPAFPLAAGQENRVPPEPRLQPAPPDWKTPRQDMSDLRKHEDDILDNYGWVDRNGGVVRIPIGEAMRLAVERGLPARQGKK